MSTKKTSLENESRPSCLGAVQLLKEMYDELKTKAKEGFETPQELWINTDHQNAILCVMRLIQKRESK
jgi:hypothetical protein